MALLGCSLGQRGQALTQLDLGAPTIQTQTTPQQSSTKTEAKVMPQTYATYQWVASPATLVRQFEQVFQSNGQSEGVLMLQVVLTQGDMVLGSEVIYERVPAQAADAVAGAQALSTATNLAAEHGTFWVNDTLSNRSK